MNLDEHPFLRFFPPAKREQLIASATLLEIDQETVLFHEGDLPDFIYLVLDGAVCLTKENGVEKFITLAQLGPGDYFGELSLLDGEPRSTSARAKAPGRLARLDQESFDQALSGAPADTFRALVSRISTHLRTTNDALLSERLRKEKMGLVGEMAGTIVHDLQTPFTIIGLACETIAKRSENPDTKHFCAVIEEQVDRMTAMVREILEFSKGIPNLQRRPVSVAHLFETFAADNQLKLRQRPLTLEISPVDTIFPCDKEKILRVLQNLFNNAADSMEKEPGRITLKATQCGDRIEFSLTDNGSGIPEAIRANLFEPFITMNKSKGTGLGLAIARSVVIAHDGQIDFQTELNVGTTFRISLPAGIALSSVAPDAVLEPV